MHWFTALRHFLTHLFALVGVAFTAIFVLMQIGALDVRGTIAERNEFFATPSLGLSDSLFETSEWATIREGLKKDAPTIERVARETGVDARLMAAVVVPEQLRFFTSEREVFKQIFEPLKILGSMSQFSLGVTGIKQETAVEIDRRLGTTTDPTLLYERLTEPHDHYYQWLYTAQFIKEIEREWAAAGYPLDAQDAGVIATLYNIGFQNSHPHKGPGVGGATITVGDTAYTYGELAQTFYSSSELSVVFFK